MNAVATLPLYSPPSEDLEATRGVSFIEMPVRQILNRCDSPRVPFRWTINPYRGCEFGCVYCYARYTHEFLDLRDPMDFERRIFVKRMAAEVLTRTLSRAPIGGARPAPAGRTKIRAHAIDARSVRSPQPTRPVNHHQVGVDHARPGFAPRDQ